MKDYPKFQRRPREIEDAIVANMSPTRRLANFLSKDDISCLISIFKKAKKSNHIDSVTQMVDDLLDDDDIFASTNIDYKPDYSKKLTVNYTAALNWNNGVSDILENKLREFYPDFEVVGGKFYLNQGSFKLHTDSGSDKNSIIYKIFTIPLLFDDRIDIFTPVFNQYWLGSCARFLRGSNGHENNTHQCIQDYEDAPIFNFTGKDFPETDYNHLSHILRDNLYGFSIESHNKWNLRDIFVIDRAKIHSSCDFSKLNNTSKLFMTIVTKLKT